MSPRIIAAGLFVVALILLDVRQHVRLVSLGYEVEVLRKERDHLKNRNRELVIETESLLALDRIEKIAIERLGMIHPLEGQIRIIPQEEEHLPSGENTRIKVAGASR